MFNFRTLAGMPGNFAAMCTRGAGLVLIEQGHSRTTRLAFDRFKISILYTFQQKKGTDFNAQDFSF